MAWGKQAMGGKVGAGVFVAPGWVGVKDAGIFVAVARGGLGVGVWAGPVGRTATAAGIGAGASGSNVPNSKWADAEMDSIEAALSNAGSVTDAKASGDIQF